MVHPPPSPADEHRHERRATVTDVSPTRTARRTAPEAPKRLDAPDLDPAHDPGPDAARERLEREGDEAAATEPLETPDGHRIRVGTASWTDPTMTAPGVFYPREGVTAEDRLRNYATCFPAVWDNSPYYAPPP